MQSTDEILTDIKSMTQELVRKLNELRIENEKLKIENTQLKQETIANSNVDLFNSPSKTQLSEDAALDIENIKQELTVCIEEVNECIKLIG